MTSSSSGLHFGWVVLAATFFINLNVDGYCFVFGILRMYLENDYPTYPSWLIAFVGGVVPTIYMAIAPVTMAINDFLGPTRCIICASLISTAGFVMAWLNSFLFDLGFIFDLFMLGIFQGISSALLYGPSIAVVAQYFPIYQHSLAAGITTCGSSVGAIVYNAIIKPLCEAYGWRGTLLIFAGISLQGLIGALAFVESLKPKKKEKLRNQQKQKRIVQPDIVPLNQPRNHPHLSPLMGNNEHHENGRPSYFAERYGPEGHMASHPMSLSVLGIVREDDVSQKPESFLAVLQMYFNAKLLFRPSVWFLLGAAATSILGFYVPPLLVNGQSKVPKWGVTPVVQANLMLIWGVFNTIGRIVAGRLGDLGIRFAFLTSFWIFITGSAISGIVLLVFPNFMFLGDVAFISFVVVYGFCVAPLIAMRSIIVSDLYGAENASALFGWFLCIQGLVQIVGYPLSAWLDSLSSMYAYGFGAACFFSAAGFVAVTFKPYFSMRRQNIKQRAAGLCLTENIDAL